MLAALLVSAPLGACGSSSPATSDVSSAEVKGVCKEVEAVLSDGPEPSADPIGYAQAQIMPLRVVRTSDRRLHEAIDRLAAAYQAFSAANRANHAASAAVTLAAGRLDAICPGAAP